MSPGGVTCWFVIVGGGSGWLRGALGEGHLQVLGDSDVLGQQLLTGIVGIPLLLVNGVVEAEEHGHEHALGQQHDDGQQHEDGHVPLENHGPLELGQLIVQIAARLICLVVPGQQHHRVNNRRKHPEHTHKQSWCELVVPRKNQLQLNYIIE